MVLALAWLGLGCSGEDDPGSLDDDAVADDDTVGDDDDDDTGPNTALHDVEASVSEAIPTVITVRWRVAPGTVEQTWVDFGRDTDYGHAADGLRMDGGDTYEAFLLGNKPLTDVHFRINAVVDGQTHRTDDAALTTGPSPAELPGIQVETLDAQRAVQGYFVTTILTIPSWAVIIDTDGDYVWWHQPPENWEAIFSSRARLSGDGRSLLYAASDTSTGGTGQQRDLLRVLLDGTDVETTDITEAHHDFVELEDGTVSLLKSESRQVEDQTVTGDRIVELWPDGTAHDVWSAWDHLDFSFDQMPELGTEWTHTNYILCDESAGTYSLSMRGLGGIVHIDRASGVPLWTLGGVLGDFTLEGAGEFFSFQHGFQLLDGGVLVFDNGEQPYDDSRVVEYSLDLGSMVATEVWSYTADPPVSSIAYGDTIRLDSGDTLVNWSTAGQLDQVGPDRELIWRLNLDMGGALGYMTYEETLNDYNR